MILKYFRVAIVLIATLLFINAYSQNQNKADSLIIVLDESVISDSLKLATLDKIATYLSSPEKALDYAEKLFILSTKLESDYYLALAYLHKGINLRLTGDLSGALESLFESAEIFSNIDLARLAQVYGEISGTYSANGDSQNALNFSSKAIEVLRSVGNMETLAINLLNTGYNYYLVNDLDTALSYYNEAEPIFEEIGLEIGKAYTIGNRALVYWKKGQPERAIEDLKKAITMLEPLGDQYGMADYYNQLGSIYLEFDDHEKALINTEKGLEMALAVDLKEQIRDASRLLAELYEERQDYAKAFAYQSQFIAYKDSIQDQETTRRLADLRTEFEVGQKEAELEVVSAEKKTQQIMSIGLGVILLLTGVFAVITYKNYATKNRINKQLEIQAVTLKEQKEDLEELNKTKDKFFSIVSHDLRGPITSFFGISPVIKSYVKSKKTDDLLEVAEDIDKSVRQLSDLLDNLLSWATQQQTQIPYHPEVLDLNHVASRVHQNLQNVAQSKSIELVVNVPEKLSAYADRNTTETIIRNLTSNALKFTARAGKVMISASQEGDKTLISVSDTGVGMNQEQLDKIFQLKGTPSQYGTDGERGLGLGLQLVKEFTQLNQGELTIQSEEGKGSTFTFSLPKNA